MKIVEKISSVIADHLKKTGQIPIHKWLEMEKITASFAPAVEREVFIACASIQQEAMEERDLKPTEEQIAAYRQKKEAKADRFRALQDRATQRSQALYEQQKKMSEIIPFGQPILVGHHSEKRDRAYRKRMIAKMDKAMMEQKKAEFYERKVKAAERNRDIRSDDPLAITKLKEKLAVLEKNQEIMKVKNAAWRQYKKTGKKDKLQAIGFTDEDIKKSEQWFESLPYFKTEKQDNIFYADYLLKNNNANIRRIKQRIEELTNLRVQETKEIEIGDVQIIDNVEENRVQLIFPGRVSKEFFKEITTMGFRSTSSPGLFQSYRGAHYIERAKSLAKEYIEQNK